MRRQYEQYLPGIGLQDCPAVGVVVVVIVSTVVVVFVVELLAVKNTGRGL